MDLLFSPITLLASIICILLFSHLAWKRNGVKSNNKGPRKHVPEASGSWPIIGHLYLLAGSQTTHKVLGTLADKFGPIFTIKLGVHRVLVVSSPKIAKECLTINDRVFASRPKAMGMELMGYNYAVLTLAPYGSYWREIRRIVVHELLSHRRLQMLAHIQVSEVKSSIIDLHRTLLRNKGSSEMVIVDMKEWFGNLILNMVVRMIFGNCYSSDKQNEDQFKKAIRRFSELLGAFVPSDIIPCLRWLDLGGYEKKMKKTAKEMDVIVEGWLDDHKKKMNDTQNIDESEDQVFMAALLSRVKGEVKEDRFGFSIDTIVKATCLAVLGAATDTTAATLTWVLSLLINNPLVLKKAQQELDNNIGRERNVEESDLKKLVYLQAIIKESMRLYPGAPLLVPHESIEDCVVGGYTVPKGTRLFINVWKIQRDPHIWTDPLEFQPERFLTTKKEIDVKGQHFELLPFGSGRRMCVGISLALEALQLTLASIIHGFEFQNPSNEQIDMTEIPGLSNLKATPLELLVAPRLLPNLYQVFVRIDSSFKRF